MRTRALDCECGQHLESTSNEGLARQIRDHVAEAHPEMQISHEQAKEMAETQGYDPGGGGGVDPRAPSGA